MRMPTPDEPGQPPSLQPAARHSSTNGTSHGGSEHGDPDSAGHNNSSTRVRI